MLKMDITYEDFSGNRRVEPYYFNMTRREVIRLQLKHSRLVDDDKGIVEGGFLEFVNEVKKRGHGDEIGQVFEDMILDAYGIKSDDGRSFEKSEELSQNFSQTAAYDQLYYNFVTDENAMKTFVENVFPKPVNPDSDTPSMAPASAHGIMSVGENFGTTPAPSTPNLAQAAQPVQSTAPTDAEIAAYLKAKNDGEAGQ